MPDESAQLLDLMSPRGGHFRFVSGHHGDAWLDLDGLFRRPVALAPFVTALAERLARFSLDGVCGPLTGGAFLAQLIARELDIAFFYVERVAPTDGAAFALPGTSQDEVVGKRIALVDDVTNAGSAVRGTYAALLACGGTPVVLGALLVLGSAAATFAAEVDIPLEGLALRESTLWEPAACPLCAAGVPLDEG